ncbi:MAG: hypothetical protein IKP10_03620 [Clostridia bacterium]|nr:hypothetical protein [Clostridia bacterium]
MSNIFTRKALNEIMSNEGLTPEQRTEQVFGLYGRALDDGYISKGAAAQAQETALDNAKTEWEKGIKVPDPKESDAYKQLQGQFDAYKQMQTARGSKEYEGVKPKFFETVYGMVDRGDGAKSVEEQLKGIRENYEEYFTAQQQENKKPTFGAPTEGSMPKGETGAVKGFSDAWGFVPKKQ